MKAELERQYVEYVRARMPALRRIAFALCGDGHRADDIVQQAITRLYVHWNRASNVDNLDQYVRTILVRVYLDERRLAWSSRVRLMRDVPDIGTVDNPDLDSRALLAAALQKVAPGQRAVLVLRFVCDLSVGETAETLGCSTGNVKSQTSQGLAALRRILGPRALVATDEGK